MGRCDMGENEVENEDEYYPDRGLVRDYKGDLTLPEWGFMMLIASHKKGKLFSTVEHICEQMRISESTFRRVRKSLLAKGLIKATERPRMTTVYRLNRRALQTPIRLTPVSLTPVTVTPPPLSDRHPHPRPSDTPTPVAVTTRRELEENLEANREANTTTTVAVGRESVPLPPARDLLPVVGGQPAEPVAERPSIKPNKYPGVCHKCWRDLDAGKGQIGAQLPDGSWQVMCIECPEAPTGTPKPEPEPAPPVEPVRTDEEIAETAERLRKLQNRLDAGERLDGFDSFALRHLTNLSEQDRILQFGPDHCRDEALRAFEDYPYDGAVRRTAEGL